LIDAWLGVSVGIDAFHLVSQRICCAHGYARLQKPSFSTWAGYVRALKYHDAQAYRGRVGFHWLIHFIGHFPQTSRMYVRAYTHLDS
jgi:hypothetical protein